MLKTTLCRIIILLWCCTITFLIKCCGEPLYASERILEVCSNSKMA
jgi:hypothetical protein